MRLFTPLLLSGLFAFSTAHAESAKPDMPAITKAITQQLTELDPNIPITGVEPSQISGLYQVNLDGGHVLYTSHDGKYIVRGDMLEIRGKEVVNLSQELRSKANAEKLKALSTDDMIVFKPKGKTKGVLYAFTDVDCGYCRKLHQEIPELSDLGIELRYIALPRGGEASPAYHKMLNAWCSTDKQQAISDLKTGKTIANIPEGPQKQACKAVIDQQLKLAQDMGITATPTLVMENGDIIPGYRPAKELAEILGINSKPE